MKVGDRVRVNHPPSRAHGMEATIWRIEECPHWAEDARKNQGMAAYYVDVDGLGRYNYARQFRAHIRSSLIPITKPKEETGTWEETFKGTDFDIRRGRDLQISE